VCHCLVDVAPAIHLDLTLQTVWSVLFCSVLCCAVLCSQWQFACSTGHAGCSAWQKARGDARLLVLLIVLLAFDLGRTFVWFSQQADELALGECALGSAAGNP
jgi:hypothetical protein